MAASGKRPVIVGVGQVLQRTDDPREAREPLALMVEAIEAAGRDAGAPKLLAAADSVYGVQGAWRYGDVARAVAQRVGAAPRETVGTFFGGNFAQGCVLDAARRIQAGELEVALVVGAETGRTHAQARRAGIELSETPAPGAPDRMLAPDKPMLHDAETARGLRRAGDVYATIESAIRHANGESVDAHRERIARLWADFAAAACENPNAWIRKPLTAAEIATAGPDNPMIAFPYPRLMNANPRVDMGAGIVVCSRDAARRAGVQDTKLVHLHAGTVADDASYLSERDAFHRSPAVRIAGARLLELAGTTIDAIDRFDLYSCFPSAPQVSSRELGVPEGRRLTVTGGLTFGGGPLNCYGLHAVARMVELLREAPGERGLVHGNGGWLAKHSFGVYAAEPPAHGYRFEDLQPEIDALPLRRTRVDFSGDVVIEAYTVAHRHGEPRRAMAACLGADGTRTWGASEDADLMQAMMREEFCGRRARLDGQGGLAVA